MIDYLPLTKPCLWVSSLILPNYVFCSILNSISPNDIHKRWWFWGLSFYWLPKAALNFWNTDNFDQFSFLHVFIDCLSLSVNNTMARFSLWAQRLSRGARISNLRPDGVITIRINQVPMYKPKLLNKGVNNFYIFSIKQFKFN